MLVRLRRYFLSGLVVLLPATLTVYLLIIIITFADGILGKYIQPYFMQRFQFYFRGLSILVGFVFIVIIGFLATNIFGRRLLDFFEGLLLRLPFFRQVYPAIKEIAMFLFSREKLAFQQVAIIEYPRKGMYSMGFLTSESTDAINKLIKTELCNVFIPTTPSPLTGFVVLVPKKEILFPDISVEEAFKFIISAGVVNPYGRNGTAV